MKKKTGFKMTALLLVLFFCASFLVVGSILAGQADLTVQAQTSSGFVGSAQSVQGYVDAEYNENANYGLDIIFVGGDDGFGNLTNEYTFCAEDEDTIFFEITFYYSMYGYWEKGRGGVTVSAETITSCYFATEEVASNDGYVTILITFVDGDVEIQVDWYNSGYNCVFDFVAYAEREVYDDIIFVGGDDGSGNLTNEYTFSAEDEDTILLGINFYYSMYGYWEKGAGVITVSAETTTSCYFITEEVYSNDGYVTMVIEFVNGEIEIWVDYDNSGYNCVFDFVAYGN